MTIRLVDGPQRGSLERRLSALLNEYSAENDSDTPDYILAKYLVECLKSYSEAVKARDHWHGYGRPNSILTELP